MKRDPRTRRLGLILRRAACVAALTIGCGSGGEAQDAASGQNKPAQEAESNVGDPIQTIDDFIASKNIDKSSSSWKTSLPKPPELEFDASKSYFWDLDTTVGPISIRLLADEAPMHVSSAIYLTRLGFFDGLTCHRVIAGFMAQGGDPLGNGRGSPGYRFDGEFSGKSRHNVPGILSQANSGPGTDGSQFFITFVATPHLDGKHTVYGKVETGMEAVKELEAWRQKGSPHQNDPLLINKAKVRVE